MTYESSTDVSDRPVLRESVAGCLIGTAIGDAFGLPFEGLSARVARRRLRDHGRYQFLGGRGMVSDDTEHSVLVAEALLCAGSEVEPFRRELARRMRLWFLGVPAGIGMATLRSCTRLMIGVPPTRSGVHSAGNGAAMRSSILGVCCGSDPRICRDLVVASSRITHTDPRAIDGALAVAAAAWASAHAGGDPDAMLHLWDEMRDDTHGELPALVRTAVGSAEAGQATTDYCAAHGMARGVSGYVLQTVPAAIHCWLSCRNNMVSGLRSLVCCGGDTDTTCAIFGAIVGAGAGRSALPVGLVDALWEWPRTVAWMDALSDRVARALETGQSGRPPRLAWPILPLRNAVFLAVVLAHGFRRLLP